MQYILNVLQVSQEDIQRSISFSINISSVPPKILRLHFLPLVLFTFCTCCTLRCLVCIVVSCLVCIVVSCPVCIVVVVLCVLL